MNTLLLMRHAKSSWNNAALDDYDRPLNRRGRDAAPRMGHWLQEVELCPDYLVTSSAVRASETAMLVAETFVKHVALHRMDNLYHASAETLLKVISELPNEATCPLIIGHNPGLEQLVERLSGTQLRLPTAAVVHLQFDITVWNEIRSTNVPCEIRQVQCPRDFDS